MQQPSNDNKVPSAVKRLRLYRALEDCGRTDVKECIELSTVECLYVYDDNGENGAGYTKWTDKKPDNETKCFKANNTTQKEIVLLPLDNRIVTGHTVRQGGVADCALLTDKEMSFIEFKTNVYSTKFIEKHDEKAIEQLWNTYDNIITPRCKNKDIDITDKVDMDFYIVFDRELDVTAASATRLNMMVAFLEQHRLPLYFNNEKDFL